MKALKYGILAYVLLCGAFYSYQHLFFFQPKKLDADHVFTFPAHTRFTEAKIPFDAHTVIDVVKFEPDSLPVKGVVLFFHGNRYNVEHYASYAPYFTQRGYACWMPDYPGYGRSSGEISIGLLRDISIQLYKMARTKYSPDSILIYGKSLGSGLAAYLASKRDCRALMLETPYYSLATLSREFLFMLPVNLLLRDDFKTYAYLPEVSAPVTIWHGNRDELIPLQEASRLLPLLKSGDRFLTIKGARHNSIPDFPLYHQSLDSLLGHSLPR